MMSTETARTALGAAGLALLIATPALAFTAVTVASPPPTMLACYGGLVMDMSTNTCVPDQSGAPPANGTNTPHCNTDNAPEGSSISCTPGEFDYDGGNGLAGTGGR